MNKAWLTNDPNGIFFFLINAIRLERSIFGEKFLECKNKLHEFEFVNIMAQVG